MKFPFFSKPEPPPAAQSSAPSRRRIMDAAREVAAYARQLSARDEEAQRQLDLRDLIDELADTSFFSAGPQLQRGAVWQAQRMYECEGYTFELVNEIADFAVGTGRLVDFGDEALNDDFYSWNWNPLNPMDTPVQLGKLMAIWLLRDGDVFLEKVAPADFSRVRLISLDARFFWSHSGGYQAQESMGVRVNDRLEPLSYIYNPSGRYWDQIQPADYREIPAQTMIHAFQTEYAGQTRGFPLDPAGAAVAVGTGGLRQPGPAGHAPDGGEPGLLVIRTLPPAAGRGHRGL